jgi:hypothetical protein
MYQKKEFLFSEALGVCRVEDVVKLTRDKGESILYYELRSVENRSKVSYIPVDHHEVVLRDLIDKEKAESIKEDRNFKNLSPLNKYEVEFVLSDEIKEELEREEARKNFKIARRLSA